MISSRIFSLTLLQISQSKESRTVEFLIEWKVALKYANHYFGLHPSSFDLDKEEDAVLRTNDQIMVTQ